MVLYQTWLEGDSVKLKESGVVGQWAMGLAQVTKVEKFQHV